MSHYQLHARIGSGYNKNVEAGNIRCNLKLEADILSRSAIELDWTPEDITLQTK